MPFFCCITGGSAEYCYTFLKGRKIIIKKAAFIRGQVALKKLGRFYVQGLTLLIQAKHGLIACKLFSGLQVKDGILFMLNRTGEFS